MTEAPMATCFTCLGSGVWSYNVDCPACNGTGKVPTPADYRSRTGYDAIGYNERQKTEMELWGGPGDKEPEEDNLPTCDYCPSKLHTEQEQSKRLCRWCQL